MLFEARGLSPKKLRLFGERNSGTNFIETLLLQNFPQLELVREYPFGKHIFFDEKFTTEDMLCVCVTRSADMWLKSTYRSQHQIWAWAETLTFSEFLRHEWHSHFSGHLLQEPSTALGLKRRHELLCDRHPITGQRIENVVALRGLKLQSYKKVPHMHQNYIFLRYEDAKADQLGLIHRLGEAFKMKPRKKPQEITQNLSRNPAVRANQDVPKYSAFTKADIKFVFDNLDLSIEHDFGYEYAADLQAMTHTNKAA